MFLTDYQIGNQTNFTHISHASSENIKVDLLICQTHIKFCSEIFQTSEEINGG